MDTENYNKIINDINNENNIRNKSKKEKNKTNHESSASIKEKIELSECTFKPKINDIDINFDKSKSNELVFNRLYKDHINFQKRKIFRKIQSDIKEGDYASFSPDLSFSSFKSSKYHRKSRSFSKSFYERQKEVIQISIKNIYII